jgi:hypothetical protein
MLLRFSLLAAVPAALAQQNITYLDGLVQALRSVGVNTLISTAQELNSTTTGQNLLTLVSDGKTNLTLFAPNDNACEYLILFRLNHGHTSSRRPIAPTHYPNHCVLQIDI